MPELTPDDMIGQTVAGRYRIVSRLGVGGMGVAYRAWDELGGVPVVVKFPKKSFLADPTFVERFHREIRLLQGLNHPHIVPVVDVGVHGAMPFVVLRFMPGGSLWHRRLRDDTGGVRPNPAGMLHLWLPAVADALDHVHSQGVVHRDVKPANIFFDAFWDAYLGDFGIAKVTGESSAFDEELTLTATHMGIGTVGYMSPERFTPKATIDGRSDQWALAVTVYELLAAAKPFTGAEENVIVEITTRPAPSLKAIRPDLPRTLFEAVHRGLSKSAADRFPTCTAFAASALHDVSPLQDEPDLARLLCPRCEKILTLPTSAAGHKGRCPKCHTTMKVAKDLGALWLLDEARRQRRAADAADPQPNDATRIATDKPDDAAPGSDGDDEPLKDFTPAPTPGFPRDYRPKRRPRRTTSPRHRQLLAVCGLLLLNVMLVVVLVVFFPEIIAKIASAFGFKPPVRYKLDRNALVKLDDRRIDAWPPIGWRREELVSSEELTCFAPVKSKNRLPFIRVLLGVEPPPSAERLRTNGYEARLWTTNAPKIGIPGKLTARACAVKIGGRHYCVEVTATADQLDEAEKIARLVAGGFRLANDPSPPARGLRATYFQDRHLGKEFRKSDTWLNLDFEWPHPQPGLPAANYSIRWTGFLIPRKSGLHAFFGERDDGVRLTVNGERIVDTWAVGRASYESKAVPLSADRRYRIEVEWYNSGGPGALSLRWKEPDGEESLVPSECLRPDE